MKKKLTILLLAALATSCAPSREQYWHDRLYAVDYALISDSLIWVISADTGMVMQIERSALASSERRKYQVEDSIRRAHPELYPEVAFGGGGNPWTVAYDSAGPYRFRTIRYDDTDETFTRYRIISRPDSNGNWIETRVRIDRDAVHLRKEQ